MNNARKGVSMVNSSGDRSAVVAIVLLVSGGCVEDARDELATESAALYGGDVEPDAYFPWQVSLSGCQGALIAPGWIATARHCVDSNWNGTVIHRRTHPVTGVVHEQTSQVVSPNFQDGAPGQNIFLDPTYNLASGSHEEALVRLDTPFVVTELLKPGHLPFDAAVPGSLGTLASNIFHGSTVVPGSFRVFRATIPSIGASGTIEVTDPNATACGGDSGSGFVTFPGGRTVVQAVASKSTIGEVCPNEPGRELAAIDLGQHLDFVLTALLARRQPNMLSTAPAICRTAPQRLPLGGSLRRADVAEIWADGVSPTTPLASFAVHPSSGTLFGLFEEWTRRVGGINPSVVRWMAGDFDGDGDQDLMAAWQDGSNTRLTMRVSTGASFTYAEWKTTPNWAASTQWVPGDFNNDGRTDVMEVRNDNNTVGFRYHRSTGINFANWVPASPVGGPGGWNSVTKWNVADFNLDGRDDLLATWPEGTGTTFTVWHMQANGSIAQDHYIAQTGGWANDMQFMVGNFDGINGPDVMVAWREFFNGVNFTTLTLHANNGDTTFGMGVNWATRNGGWAANIRWRAGDFDANGRQEVLAVWDDGGRATLTVRRWPTNGESALIQEHWAERRVAWQPSTDWCVGTFDEN